MTEAVIDASSPAADPHGAGFHAAVSAPNLGWRIFRNTAGPVVGRVVVAASRLVIAALIVRFTGVATFGEYSLLLGILMIAEWILDFGTTEIFVREICREPARAPQLLRTLISAKIVQLPAAVLVLAVILVAFRYPAHLVQAGLVGGASLIFFVGILVYRVVFKAALNMEREVAAELVSVAAMIPMVAFVSMHKWSLTALLVCHVASRVIYFAFCAIFGRNRLPPLPRSLAWQEVTWGLQTSSAIGFAGFLVVVYESVDILLLSRLSGVTDVAYYSAAQRFIVPVLMALYAVGATLYPVAASYWPHAKERFEEAAQRGFDAVVLLAGLAIACVVAGAEMIVGLMGHPLLPAAKALIVLSVLALVKGVSATVGPLLYVVQSQKNALQLIAVALVVKTLVIAIVAPKSGYLGVAFAVVGVEVLFSLVPTLYLLRIRAGFVVRWRVTIQVVLFTAVAALLPRLYFRGSIVAIAIAFAIYVLSVFAARLVRVSELQALVRWKTA